LGCTKSTNVLKVAEGSGQTATATTTLDNTAAGASTIWWNGSSNTGNYSSHQTATSNATFALDSPQPSNVQREDTALMDEARGKNLHRQGFYDLNAADSGLVNHHGGGTKSFGSQDDTDPAGDGGDGGQEGNGGASAGTGTSPGGSSGGGAYAKELELLEPAHYSGTDDQFTVDKGYRDRFKEALKAIDPTFELPGNWEIHHVNDKKLVEAFGRAEIDINELGNLRAVRRDVHELITSAQNTFWWDKFRADPNFAKFNNDISKWYDQLDFSKGGKDEHFYKAYQKLQKDLERDFGHLWFKATEKQARKLMEGIEAKLKDPEALARLRARKQAIIDTYAPGLRKALLALGALFTIEQLADAIEFLERAGSKTGPGAEALADLLAHMKGILLFMQRGTPPNKTDRTQLIDKLEAYFLALDPGRNLLWWQEQIKQMRIIEAGR
jgi:hypothetical protein